MATPDPNLSTQLLDEAVKAIYRMLQLSASLEADTRTRLETLGKKITSLIDDHTPGAGLTATALSALFSDVKDAINTAYTDIATDVLSGMEGVAGFTTERLIGEVNQIIGIDFIDAAISPAVMQKIAEGVMVNGLHVDELWQYESDRLQQKFLTEMRLGMVQGESVADLMRRIRGTAANDYRDGIMELTADQAEVLVRSGVMATANDARLELFNQNSQVISQVQWLATLDNRTCIECAALDGMVWDWPDSGISDYGELIPAEDAADKGFPGPIAHPNCRCTLIPIIASWEDLAAEKGLDVNTEDIPEDTRASMDGQVAATTTFGEWLAGQPASVQDEVLGQTRADMFRAGQLDMTDLTDASNDPLTLAEL